MKVLITITKEEKNSTENLVLKDPCTNIECGNIDCNCCPLREVAEALREAQREFNTVLQSIDEE